MATLVLNKARFTRSYFEKMVIGSRIIYINGERSEYTVEKLHADGTLTISFTQDLRLLYAYKSLRSIARMKKTTTNGSNNNTTY